MAIEKMYDRLIAGEAIDVLIVSTGKEFTVAPAYSSLMPTTVLGYSIIVDGAVVPGHNGTLMDRETIEEWASDEDLVERVDDEDGDDVWGEANDYYFASRGCSLV